MPSYFVKAGLCVVVCLFSTSLFANQMTVMAQGSSSVDNGIEPVNTNHGSTSSFDNGIVPVNTVHHTSSSQISVSISIVTSTLDPSPLVTTVTGAGLTVTATTSMAPVATTVTGPGTTVTAPPGGITRPFSLPDQQAVITQAPCVKGCLQAAVVAPAVGVCGRSAGIAIDNGCACLSAPLNALQALTICAAAACPMQGAAGTMDPSSGSVVVASLYNAYCMTAVDPALYSQATAGGLSSWTDTSSTTTNIIPVTVTVGTPIPGEPSGNSTFTGNIPITVTSTDIITASVSPSGGATSAGGASAGSNAGVQNGVGRVSMSGLIMNTVTASLAVILTKLLL